MAGMEIAVDLGTSYISIYQKGAGMVLREPCVAACENGAQPKVKAVGTEAKKLIGKIPEDTTIIFPVFEGGVANANVAITMLDHFIGKILPPKIVRPKMKAIVNIPCGMNPDEQNGIERVVYESGIRDAAFIEAPVCAAFGVDAPITKSMPCMIVDIGGGETDIGVLTLNGIITGCSLGIGGNNVDSGIIDHLMKNYHIKVGLLSAERVKIQAASLNEKDTASAMVSGRDVKTSDICSKIITSKDIIPVTQYYYGKILNVIRSVIHSLPEEVSSEINRAGIYLCGGASRIAGLTKVMQTELKLKVFTIEDPSCAAINGAGKLLGEKELIKQFAR